MLNELLNQIFEGLMMQSPFDDRQLSQSSPALVNRSMVLQGDSRSSSWASAIVSSFFGSIFTSSILSLSCLAAYNIRWKHLLIHLKENKPRKLPYRKVEAHDKTSAKSIVVVLLHGMWNDASYFEEWQDYLAEGGYTSYAVDLLPGERWLPGGLLQQELVRDLEYTLQEDIAPTQPYVLMGHSRGGIVVQGALQCSPTIRKNAAATGVILMGSYPLGYIPPLRSTIIQQRKDGIFHNWLGALNILLLGKLRNKEYTKRIFLLPTANERSPKIARYLRESVQAPSDGVLYCAWWWRHYYYPSSSSPIMPDVPALIVGAEHDVLVPPLQVKDVFLERFPNDSTQHVIIPHQAHAFRDGGWQLSMVEPLMDWLDCRNEAIVNNNNNIEGKKERELVTTNNNNNGDWSQRVLDERKPLDGQ